MHYKRISADCHLDMPWMPPDLFVENARRDLKERMPYVEDGPDGPQWVAKNGANFGLLYGVGPGGAKHVPGQNVRVDIMAERGLYSDAKQGKSAATTRICASRTWRWTGSMPKSSTAFSAPPRSSTTHEASNEMLRIYNDWLKDFCSHYPDRQIGLACLPYGNIDEAVAEVHRVAKMGLRGLELSCSWDMEPMWHPDWEQLWQAVNDVELPLHFHTFPTTPPRSRTEARHVQRAAMFTGVSAFQMGLIHIIAAMMGAGVFERYPDLRVAFGESGVGWLAYALHRMDFEFEDRFRDLMKLKPREYWNRQCRGTFQFDPSARSCSTRSASRRSCGARTTRTPTASGRNRTNTSTSSSPACRPT